VRFEGTHIEPGARSSPAEAIEVAVAAAADDVDEPMDMPLIDMPLIDMPLIDIPTMLVVVLVMTIVVVLPPITIVEVKVWPFARIAKRLKKRIVIRNMTVSF
jgi:hypothetical protein